MEPELEKIREVQKVAWNKSSASWKKWDDMTMNFMKPTGDEIIHALQLKDADTVLDFATGTNFTWQVREAPVKVKIGSRNIILKKVILFHFINAMSVISPYMFDYFTQQPDRGAKWLDLLGKIHSIINT